MPNSPNPPTPAPKEPDWFDRMPLRTRALLLALLCFAVSLVTFLLGVHDWHSGQPVANMAGRSDWTDSFLLSAGSFVIGVALTAVAMGWLRSPRPDDPGATQRK